MRKHSKGNTVMSSHSYGVSRCAPLAGRVGQLSAIALALRFLTLSCGAQTLIYQEGFNTDGETNVPPRYTSGGHDVHEPDRILSELLNADQKGPIYWARN